MASIYLTDEVVEEIDRQRKTPLGDVDRSEFLRVVLEKHAKTLKNK